MVPADWGTLDLHPVFPGHLPFSTTAAQAARWAANYEIEVEKISDSEATSPIAWALLDLLHRASQGGPKAPEGFELEYGLHSFALQPSTLIFNAHASLVEAAQVERPEVSVAAEVRRLFSLARRPVPRFH